MRKIIIGIACLTLLTGCQYLQPKSEVSPVEEKKVIGTSETATQEATTTGKLEIKQMESFQGAVVHILCETDKGISAGSGIVYDSKGLVLTNNHVIPNDNTYLGTKPEGCLITLPDPETGLVTEKIYYANPAVVKDISKKYDLATLQIYNVESLKAVKIAPELPSKFTAIDVSKSCPLEKLKLKDKIEVYGYPDVGSEIGTSISLVVTNGIISSFPGDGTIMTDAKINEGNSGGLAVKEDGCFIGIPSAGYAGAMESYGYIISTDLINKYFKEIVGKPNLPEMPETPATGQNLGKTSISNETTYPYPNYAISYNESKYDFNVELIQRELKSFGYEVTIDGYFGPQTLQAVKAYQKTRGLVQDGVVGPETWAALFSNQYEPSYIETPVQEFPFIKVSGYEFLNDGKGTVRINGTTSSNCSKIVVHGPNTKNGYYDDYTLQKYKKGNTSFHYFVRPDLFNIGIGENTYTFTAHCDGGPVSQVYTLIL
jgi:peptidoglycan hydrolase-like protein with peptidoglycan-binding domain